MCVPKNVDSFPDKSSGKWMPFFEEISFVKGPKKAFRTPHMIRTNFANKIGGARETEEDFCCFTECLFSKSPCILRPRATGAKGFSIVL